MSFIQTLSGKKFNFINPTADDVDIEVIANALFMSRFIELMEKRECSSI